ncbi:hypothetical protein, partial [Stenotrophomonas maltophilia group sp. RNC7]|uniref:hypothetical protein n=1 Tax=Stenotrophomonas maltophilia group sp. RNC7 TaxID=3071467 RepID=UPI0027E1FA10
MLFARNGALAGNFGYVPWFLSIGHEYGKPQPAAGSYLVNFSVNFAHPTFLQPTLRSLCRGVAFTGHSHIRQDKKVTASYFV